MDSLNLNQRLNERTWLRRAVGRYRLIGLFLSLFISSCAGDYLIQLKYPESDVLRLIGKVVVEALAAGVGGAILAEIVTARLREKMEDEKLQSLLEQLQRGPIKYIHDQTNGMLQIHFRSVRSLFELLKGEQDKLARSVGASSAAIARTIEELEHRMREHVEMANAQLSDRLADRLMKAILMSPDHLALLADHEVQTLTLSAILKLYGEAEANRFAERLRCKCVNRGRHIQKYELEFTPLAQNLSLPLKGSSIALSRNRYVNVIEFIEISFPRSEWGTGTPTAIISLTDEQLNQALSLSGQVFFRTHLKLRQDHREAFLCFLADPSNRGAIAGMFRSSLNGVEPFQLTCKINGIAVQPKDISYDARFGLLASFDTPIGSARNHSADQTLFQIELTFPHDADAHTYLFKVGEVTTVGDVRFTVSPELDWQSHIVNFVSASDDLKVRKNREAPNVHDFAFENYHFDSKDGLLFSWERKANARQFLTGNRAKPILLPDQLPARLEDSPSVGQSPTPNS
jgi:hypothetical protein